MMKHSQDHDEDKAKVAVLKHIQSMMGKHLAGKLKPAHAEMVEVSVQSPKDAMGDEDMVGSKTHAMQGEEPIHHDEVMGAPEGSMQEEMSESPYEEQQEQADGEHDEDDSKVQAMLMRRFGKKKSY